MKMSAPCMQIEIVCQVTDSQVCLAAFDSSITNYDKDMNLNIAA